MRPPAGENAGALASSMSVERSPSGTASTSTRPLTATATAVLSGLHDAEPVSTGPVRTAPTRSHRSTEYERDVTISGTGADHGPATVWGPGQFPRVLGPAVPPAGSEIDELKLHVPAADRDRAPVGRPGELAGTAHQGIAPRNLERHVEGFLARGRVDHDQCRHASRSPPVSRAEVTHEGEAGAVRRPRRVQLAHVGGRREPAQTGAVGLDNVDLASEVGEPWEARHIPDEHDQAVARQLSGFDGRGTVTAVAQGEHEHPGDDRQHRRRHGGGDDQPSVSARSSGGCRFGVDEGHGGAPCPQAVEVAGGIDHRLDVAIARRVGSFQQAHQLVVDDHRTPPVGEAGLAVGPA